MISMRCRMMGIRSATLARTSSTSTFVKTESDLRETFNRDGFLKINGFCDMKEVVSMMERMEELIQRDFVIEDGGIASFRTDDKQVSAQGSDDYFLDSGTCI